MILNNSNILYITLNKGEFLNSLIIKLYKNWTLRFICGKNLLGRKILLNIQNANIKHEFNEFSTLSVLDSNNIFDYTCNNFGSFKYEFYISDNNLSELAGEGFFTVISEWILPETSKVLSLNSFSICTHLSKLLGPLCEWEDRLKVAKKAGYNVFHLTPIQLLGISNSSYSIADFQQINPIFKASLEDVEFLVKKIEHKWNILTIQDVVWNHTAKNSAWLLKHPECAYNCNNSPHLRPAFVIDRSLYYFSNEIAEGKWVSYGLPIVIDEESHLNALNHILHSKIFPSIKIEEFFQIDVKKHLNLFQKNFYKIKTETKINESELTIIQDLQYCRFGSTVDIEKCIVYFKAKLTYLKESLFKEDFYNACYNEFVELLNRLNFEIKAKIQNYCDYAINAILGLVRYERVDKHGLRLGAVTNKSPLVTNYFLYLFDEKINNWKDDEKLAYDKNYSPFFMAFNGWVMNADPLINFAESSSLTYLKRELICWGDCVKLNYGNKPSDCPFLWNYMQEYTEKCAQIFHGFRIDNCHSTPIHVAEFLLKAARRVRQNLYVVAELFTESESIDNLFVNRLGINSLIREAQNAPDCYEQGRFIYRYSENPIGSFFPKFVRPAISSVAHALLYDQTHDNKSPYEKRTVYDYIPTAAMIAMSLCALGSNRGYDEFINFNIDVVHEKRFYKSWSDIEKYFDKKRNMILARRLFNDLHFYLEKNGFNEIFVDQINKDVVVITRHNPITHESIILIAHTCFENFKWNPDCFSDVYIYDDVVEILFEIKTIEDTNFENFKDCNNILNGLLNIKVEIYEHFALNKSESITIKDNKIHFKTFPSGSVLALKVKSKSLTTDACNNIKKVVENSIIKNELKLELKKLDISLFNYILFRCEAEEYDEINNGSYEVPKYGKLVYCGFQGIYSVLKKIQETNDLGHPLCENLRQGMWLCEYITNRLQHNQSLKIISNILKNNFALLNNIVFFLKPCYFELLFSYFYSSIIDVLNEKIFINSNLPQLNITRSLSHSSLSFLSFVKSAKLPPTVTSLGVIEKLNLKPSLSAGFPHFAQGIWRNWGRDTFISLPGVLIINGFYAQAYDIIIAFAGTLRHGLIPNLLVEGKNPRYNCRDAVWFWIVAILRYIDLAPNGIEILHSKVLRLYPNDESEYLEDNKIEYLYETIYEAICRHFDGISFRERNAGLQIDEHMTYEGFQVDAFVDIETGLVFGGNPWNCGTWMDKMGCSDRAGNRGLPATPRDGAAVEIQGLALFIAEQLGRLSLSHKTFFPFLKIKSKKCCWTWNEWAKKLRSSFKLNFYVSENCSDEFVNRHEIIKDLYKSKAGYTDFQLRPNFCIALNATPDILEPEQSWKALQLAQRILDGPLGIATLDPEDYAYNGYYNNDDDGTNKITAKGWNYHQGPEWLWVKGQYFSAKLKVAYLLAKKNGNFNALKATINEVLDSIFVYSDYISNDLWTSLPELTNRNGTICHHSCKAQAWSIGCFTEALHTLNVLIKNEI